MKSAGFSVDSPALLLEAQRFFCAGASSDCIGLAFGISEIRRGLHRVGVLATNIGNAELLDELERLGVLRPVAGATPAGTGGRP